MSPTRARETDSPPARVAIDIGSTVIKVAELDGDGALLNQDLCPRDYEIGIKAQVETILETYKPNMEVVACSSANGGLRVGIICLTKGFSGAVMRNQVLSAGANPIFVRDLDEVDNAFAPVDILLVGGGIDCPDAAPLETRLARFDPSAHRFGSLIYAGNGHLSQAFLRRFQNAVVVDNPIADSLRGPRDTVANALRRAYLDDLVYKEGVSELAGRVSGPIRATPEIVSQGFYRAVSNRSALMVITPCLLLDIGGATTDVHYTVEVVRDESVVRPPAGLSVARYVFTDLGISASLDTALLQLRTHPRLYEFLSRVVDDDVREVYRLLREGEYDPPPDLLAYACLFLALDRFAHGRGAGLATADFGRVAQIVLTGGAAQLLDEQVVSRVTALVLPDRRTQPPPTLIDRSYRIWTEGMS